MVLNRILVAFVLYMALLGETFSTRAEKINVAAGKSVFLQCRSKTDQSTPNRIVWKHNGRLLVRKMKHQVFKGERSVTYILKDEETFSLELPKAEPGQYVCDVDGKQVATYDIEVWTVTGSKSGYLLQGDTLKLSVSPVKDATIEWFEPYNTKVTGNEPRWKRHMGSLQILNLTVQDNGIWKCHISHPDYNINLSYNVKVLGFSNPLDEFHFATINSSILLSCPLNIDLQEKRDQEIPKVQSWKWLKNNILMTGPYINNNSSFSLSNVHSGDAGQYQCRLGFKHGTLSKTINLIFVNVSAIPPVLKSKEDSVTLCGHITPLHIISPLTELCWVYVNNSTSEPKCGSPVSEHRFCHIATTEGLWRCDFKVNNDVKISIDYILGKFQEKLSNETTLENTFSLIKIASGIGAMLLLLILVGVCVPTCKRIKQKQQQAKRMAQIKQHLLAKRTCQCQRDLPNDYYHT
ncbi:T-cell surface glycoprotein CD4-like isoform X1 [Thamnophis elegans]|uniref:T-cell surface glycoprotein CD4-like isoform X1 n=1 Tax=Thamnophis elegans TaxID=35005 RepID=UPI001377106E|nr:T-cell surface glycoprotein CD4-like isoform X1 [Thamnophis elegans]